MYTIAEAAAELHMSVRQVQRLVESGELETVGEAPDRLIPSLDQVKSHARPSFPSKVGTVPTILAGIYAKWPDPPIIWPAPWPEDPALITWRWELARVQDPVDDDVPEMLASDGTPWDSKYYALVRPFTTSEQDFGKQRYSFEETRDMWEWKQLPDELPESGEDTEETDYDD